MTAPRTEDDGGLALTRSDLLRRRGYSEAIINGHPVEPVTSVELADVTCAVCSEAIPPERLRRYTNVKTCSQTCAAEAERRRDRARNRDRRTSSAGAKVLTRSTDETGVTTMHPKLSAFVKELADMGLVVSLEMDGLHIRISA